MLKYELSGDNLDLELFGRIINDPEASVCVSDAAKRKIRRCRKIVDTIIENDTIRYGINTGFGKFSNVIIDKKDTIKLQKNIVLSHAVGTGEPFEKKIAKGVMLLKLNSFLQGYSGVRMEVAETLISMINKNVIPVIPQKGSVGASGDLAPLAHMALVMTGKGKAYYLGKMMSGGSALKKAGITPLELRQKEGLAILNGTQVMTSVLAVSLLESQILIKSADIIGSLSLEALKGSPSAFDERIQMARPHKGQIDTAYNLRLLLKGSKIVMSHKNCPKVQDAYSLRCMPQVHGAVKDTYNHAKKILETEMNSVTDNPLVFDSGNEVISGGNFHGEPLALVSDFMTIAVSELANISERRIEYLLDTSTNDGLPAFLTSKGGLNSGFMMTQVTAAALVSENKVLSHPASVDSIPTSANKEDHVSMGAHAARKLYEVCSNAKTVLAIELLCAAQGIELRGSENTSTALKKVVKEIRNKISFMKSDRFIQPDIINAEYLISQNKLIDVAERSGKLKI